MTAVIFDGRAFAKAKEEELTLRVQKLKENGIIPKMVSIVIGDIDGSMKYQEMKKKAGERIGIEVEIVNVDSNSKKEDILFEIEKANQDKRSHGIMVQLPLPKSFALSDRQEILEAIDPKKDVDGMRIKSSYTAPVVRAVLQAFDAALTLRANTHESDVLRGVSVVGARGFEGEKIVEELEERGYLVTVLDKGHDLARLLDMDVVISATGNPNLITGDMIKEGTICIDVGAPKGDFEFETVSPKASFITPVPGGIGPMTIALLMENIVIASEDR